VGDDDEHTVPGAASEGRLRQGTEVARRGCGRIGWPGCKVVGSVADDEDDEDDDGTAGECGGEEVRDAGDEGAGVPEGDSEGHVGHEGG